jgi:hypothetical protein
MPTELLAPATEPLFLNVEDRFPGKTVIVRDPSWPLGTLLDQYTENIASEDPTLPRVKPNVVLLRPNGEAFLETNSHGLLGPEVDFSQELTAVWGDSCVAGWGRGWIDGLSERFPGRQILNGGLNMAPIDTIVTRAIEMNRRLPIKHNVLFAGWCTMMRSRDALRMVYQWVHRLCEELPNLILCTQPTALNERVAASDITPHLASAADLGFRAGFTFWSDLAPTQELVQTMYHLIQQQNEVLRRVAKETAMTAGRFVPVIDFYRRFYTGNMPDFREHFFDAGHFRVEAYPMVQQVFCEELGGYLH